MRSSIKFILLIFSTIIFSLVAECQRTVPSQKKNKKFEKVLNYINKPAIKSFQTEHGYIFDCVDIQKQLAFDHPLLKNHTIQLKPATIPRWTRDNTTSKRSSSMPFREDDISCPHGTVIIKRTTLEDLIQIQRLKSVGFYHPTSKDNNVDLTHHFAFANYKHDIYGAKGNINIWDPHVSPDQFSLASISVSRGARNQLQSISAGWIVYQSLNQNHSVLFTSWTADGLNKTGCYNTLCPGFVQVSRKFALGALAKPVSSYGGQQYHLEASLYQDFVTGDWWFMLVNEPIGYWPRSLFNVGGLSNGASVAFWGGEVSSPAKVKSPNMGSGHFPGEGYKKAAYVNGLKVIDRETGKVKIPPPYTIKLFADSLNCYDVERKIGRGEYWSRAIFFGGRGGCTS